jgi:hypothetical protein
VWLIANGRSVNSRSRAHCNLSSGSGFHSGTQLPEATRLAYRGGQVDLLPRPKRREQYRRFDPKDLPQALHRSSLPMQFWHNRPPPTPRSVQCGSGYRSLPRQTQIWTAAARPKVGNLIARP